MMMMMIFGLFPILLLVLGIFNALRHGVLFSLAKRRAGRITLSDVVVETEQHIDTLMDNSAGQSL